MNLLTRHYPPSSGGRAARRPRLATSLAGGIALAVAAAIAPLSPAAAATIPNAPSGLSARAGSGAITLFWADNSADETGFEIERCTRTATGCTFAPLATTVANMIAHSDQSALDAFRYRIRAVNAAGASAWSAEASLPGGFGVPSGYPSAIMTATPTSGIAPLTVAFDGSQSSMLDFGQIATWSWSFGDGATASGSTASHVYTAPGTYRAALTVATAAGVASLTSTTITVSAPPAPPLPAPANLAATSPRRARVALTWTNGTPTTATSMIVSRCTGSTCQSLSPLAILPATTSAWTDTSVRSGTTYRYVVSANNGTTTSMGSNIVTIRSR